MATPVYTEEEKKARQAAQLAQVAEAKRIRDEAAFRNTRMQAEAAKLRASSSPWATTFPQPKAPAPAQAPVVGTDCPHKPKTADALEWILGRMSREVRLNLRSQGIEWRQGSEEWQPMTKRAAAHIRTEIQRSFNFTFSQMVFEDCVESIVYEHEVDPLKVYLEGLPPPTGRNILPNALATCMNVREGYEELAKWASKYMFLGVVWRTFKPGTKLDEIPVLVGGGGIGKSTFPDQAVPQHIPGLYGSGLELNSTSQRMVESLLGRAICEMSEMVGLGNGDMNRIKDFISRTNDDGTRLVYARHTEPLPRRCIMVGTADKDVFLPENNNHRRFVPILLGAGRARKVRTYMAKNRDRLWAEAVVLYRNGETAHLPERLKGLAKWSVDTAQGLNPPMLAHFS